MILLDCNDVIFKFLLFPVKNLLNLLMIIAPILLIVSLVYTFIKMTTNPEDKKIIKRLVNSCMALLFLFFIPLIINVLMSMLGDNTDITKCWNDSSRNSKIPTYIPIDGNKTTKIIKEEKYEKGVPRTLKFNYKGNGTVKSQFFDETMRIVEAHINDFNYNNFHQFMSSQGGADKYIQNLGGVFKKVLWL